MEDPAFLWERFLEALAKVQEVCVQTALLRQETGSLEDRLYDITAEVIVRVLEVLDGYAEPDLGRLRLLWEKSGRDLRESSPTELHDAVCAYLRGAD